MTHTRIIEQFKLTHIEPTDSFQDVLDKLCSVSNNDDVFINYAIFKLVATPSTYDAILAHVVHTIKKATQTHPTTTVRVYMKTLTIGDLDKHKAFISGAVQTCNTELADTLKICHCYKTPFVFAQIYNIISTVIDKETRQKIHVVNS